MIPEIPLDADPTCRTVVLRILDEGKVKLNLFLLAPGFVFNAKKNILKKKGCIPKDYQQTQEAVLGLNAYSIRILSRDTKV